MFSIFIYLEIKEIDAFMFVLDLFQLSIIFMRLYVYNKYKILINMDKIINITNKYINI